MEIEKELSSLPKIEPREEFITELGNKLIVRHIEEREKKNLWSIVLNPSFVLGGTVVLIIIFTSGFVFGYPDLKINEFDSNSFGNSTDRKNNYENIVPTEDAVKEDNYYFEIKNYNGVLERSDLSEIIYELSSEGKALYLVDSQGKNLDEYEGKEVEIEGYLKDDYNNGIQFIEINSINIKK